MCFSRPRLSQTADSLAAAASRGASRRRRTFSKRRVAGEASGCRRGDMSHILPPPHARTHGKFPAVAGVWGLSTNKEPCGVTCGAGALGETQARASPSLIRSNPHYDLHYSPPAARSLWFVPVSNKAPRFVGCYCSRPSFFFCPPYTLTRLDVF